MKFCFFGFLILLFSCNNKRADVKDDKAIIIEEKKIESKIISDSTNILENKVQQLQLEYVAWGCACANWITPADREKFENKGLAEKCIFIEPAGKNLMNPEEDSTFNIGKQSIIVTGQFYQRKDYPQGMIQTEEQLDKARVFRYTSIRIIKKK